MKMKVKMKLTREIARSAATDAADRQKRKAGRKAWSEDDYNLACREFERLWPAALDVRYAPGCEPTEVA